VRILLPPSEAKTTGGRGRPVGSGTLSGPLAEPRRLMLDALATLVDADPAAAAAALALPRGVADEALAVNRGVSASRTTAALRRYAGVVYEGLGFDAMSPQVQRLAARGVLIFSGLWGVLRGDEPVPAYRVPAKAVLPGIGVAGTFWRPRLDEVVPDLLGGGRTVLVGNLVQNQFTTARDWPFGSAVSIVLMLLVTLLVWAFLRKQTGDVV